jgi:tetratricopeptide (TPR) repeat protein
MILRVYKSKLSMVSIFVLVVAVFTLPSPARGQGSDAAPFNEDLHSNESFRGRNGKIIGTVYMNRRGKPASQVLVSIRSLTAGVNQTVLTDFGGHFELGAIPSGSYEVSAEERGLGFASTITEASFFPAEVTLYLNSSDASNAPPRGENPYTVSEHELKIPRKAQGEYGRGLDLMAKKDFAGSLAHFNKAAAAYPDYYEAIYHAGLVEFRLNHQDKAAEAFQKAIDLSGGHYARPQFAYGLLLCNQGKPKEAENLIRRGLETDSDSPEGHLFLGIALLDQNRLDESEKSLREALLRRPQYADVYLVLADVHGKRKDYPSQIQDLDTYLKLAPSASGVDYVRKVREAAQHLAGSSPQLQK